MRFLSFLRNPNPNISSIPFKSLLRSSAAGVRTHRRWFPTPSSPSSAQVRRIFASFSSCPPPRTEMAVVATEEEGAARRLWIRSRKEATFAAYTPFVVCLASGVLELDVFRHYVAQDVHFLRAFAQAYEMAGDCADDDDDKAALSMLRKAILDELKMHDSVVDEWGVDLSKETTPNSATMKYTEFLLATAAGKVGGGKGPVMIVTPFEKTKIAAYTVGAMTPCMRLYAFLGKEIMDALQTVESSHPFKKWIDTYSSKSFEASVLQIEDLLDKLSVTLTGEELKLIERLYRQAMNLEIDFFLAQPITQPTVLPLKKLHDPTKFRFVIFSDFDLTCTIIDSSAILAEIAILTAPKSDQIGPQDAIPQRSSAALRDSWNALSSQYTEEYEECIESILPSEKATKFDYDGLRKALDQLSHFEKRANSRVIESEVLKGLSIDDIKRAGELLNLQDGCADFFRKIVNELNVDVHVLSYCWCGDLIRSAFSSGGLSALNIHSNEFKYEESISTGEIVSVMESPIDKATAFKEILESSSGDDCKKLSVYIGDSVGDLLCLLEADVGIVIGSSSSLRRVGEQFGVSFVPLLSGLVKKQKELVESDKSPIWSGLSGVLYTVSGWTEVHAFILGS